MLGNPRPLHGSGSSWAAPGQGRRLHGLSNHLEPEEPRPQDEAANSGMVAAAGVVNQADEQRILLPGYFTTPGLHPTHPLQGSLAGPQDTGTWGQGGLGQLTVKDNGRQPIACLSYISQSPGTLCLPSPCSAQACEGSGV